jgi:hypothetical protein
MVNFVVNIDGSWPGAVPRKRHPPVAGDANCEPAQHVARQGMKVPTWNIHLFRDNGVVQRCQPQLEPFDMIDRQSTNILGGFCAFAAQD